MGNGSIQRDKKIWIFNAGDAFSGNPKWLFMYIVNNHKDIKPYWLCYKKTTQSYVRRLGYKAYMFNSSKGKKIMSKAGVYVVNQVKEVIQPELENITMLNLWHGVGCKSIEKSTVDFGFLNERIAKKYIRNNTFFKNNQLFLVTSPLMEKHFKSQCGIDDDKVIRGGYPCCMYRGKVKTYNHDILKQKGLSQDAKIAIYCPTYRDASANEFFGKAIPDIEKLIKKLEEVNMLLIFKMHPFMEKDIRYNQLKNLYANCKNLLFWDNNNDVYEIFDKIDLGIIDYSSMFYDMLAGGVKHFVRYMFDIDNKDNVRDFVFDVKEMTCGKECNNFDELVEAFSDYKDDNEEEKNRIYKLFWDYTSEDSFENIINTAMNFTPTDNALPTLYSFDIFDTLIKRKGLKPVSIFRYVREMLIRSNLNYPDYLKRNFIKARMCAEANAREFYKKLSDVQPVEYLEISFEEIYDRLAVQYKLSDEQKLYLMNLEKQAEIDNCIPYEENLEKFRELVSNNEKVLLISDMYLPEETIRAMLNKVDPILNTVPLYLSSKYGVQKTTKKLFIKAYKDIEDYNFGEWIHYGDNDFADRKMPSQLGIKTINHKIPDFNRYEKILSDRIATYDGYLVANTMLKFRQQHPNDIKEQYAYEYCSAYFVPYIHWCLKDAIEKGYKCLYFISRDGHHLKRIADTIIEIKGYNIKTKYIYGSRKAWRIPSFINKIDDEFFSHIGNFAQLKNYEQVLKALGISDLEFDELFPELNYIKRHKVIPNVMLKDIRSTFSDSVKYRKIIMDRADKERGIVLDYLRQEIDFNEKFAFVEYWGRGYTQDCLTRLMCAANGKDTETPCYYLRSIYPTMGLSTRYNYTTSRESLIFVEALFANLPYKSVTGYKRENNKIEPIINPCDNDMELHEAFEKYLVQFCKDFYANDFLDEDAIERELLDFGLKYYNDFQTDPVIVKSLGHLKDSVELYGKPREFAPPINMKVLIRRASGEWFDTKSIAISFARSKPIYKKIYQSYHNKWRKKRIFKFLSKIKRKII